MSFSLEKAVPRTDLACKRCTPALAATQGSTYRCPECVKALDVVKRRYDAALSKEANKKEKEKLKQKKTEKKQRSGAANSMALLKENRKRKREQEKDGEVLTDERKKKRVRQILAYIRDELQNGTKRSASVPSKRDIPAGIVEFQASNELYDHLRARVGENKSSSMPVFFHGCYTIVASPKFDNQKRARRVAKDLRRFNVLPEMKFNRDINAFKGVNTTKKYTLLMKCQCSNHSPSTAPGLSAPPPITPPSTSAPGAPSLKRTSSDLLAFFKKEKVVHVGPKCTGTIKIVAEDDLSHARCKGQRISVHVKHGNA